MLGLSINEKTNKQNNNQTNKTQNKNQKKALRNKNHTNKQKGTVTNYQVIVKQNFHFIVHVLIQTGKKKKMTASHFGC